MNQPVFYSNNIVDENFILLDPEESRHCLKVLRFRAGKLVIVVDGKGSAYTCEVFDENIKHCRLKIIEKQTIKLRAPYFIHLVMAIPKKVSRFEWFLEKITEIGVDRITPLICKRSERERIRIDRMEKILVAAMKQSQQSFLPHLDQPMAFVDLINEYRVNKTCVSKMIAWCGQKDKMTVKDFYKKGNNATILIGPEGDFDREELALAEDAGFTAVTLGDNRLRIETAGILVVGFVNMVNQ